MRVLIVEDEPALRESLADLLRGAGHDVEAVGDGQDGVDLATRTAFDLVLLDLVLPGLGGIEACRRMRTARPGLPVIMVTALGDERDVVRGLKTGADDYLTKPFGPRELLARIDAVRRRVDLAPREPEILRLEDGEADLGRGEARVDGRVSVLTAREMGILRCLHRLRHRAVTRAELLESVWGVPGHLATRAVDMAMVHLRQKVEKDPARPQVVVSVKGVGYAWGAASASNAADP